MREMSIVSPSREAVARACAEAWKDETDLYNVDREFVETFFDARITSYNVCYTKLLRQRGPVVYAKIC